MELPPLTQTPPKPPDSAYYSQRTQKALWEQKFYINKIPLHQQLFVLLMQHPDVTAEQLLMHIVLSGMTFDQAETDTDDKLSIAV